MQQVAGSILDFFALPIAVCGQWLHPIAERAASVVLSALWQSAAVAAALAVCLRIAPRTAAAHRFLLWAVAFAASAALPVASLASLVWGAAGHSAGLPAAAKPLFLLDVRWSVAIACLWLGASLYRAVDLALNARRLRHLWKSCRPVRVSRFAVRGRGKIEICSTTELERPGVIGFLAPRILIPEWLLAELTQGELDQIVLHESEHLRRGDDWTNLLQKLLLIAFPLNPVLVWMEFRLCLEREMACDEGVVRRTGAPRAYAACLTRLAERGLLHRTGLSQLSLSGFGSASMGALSLGAWRRRPELARRVHTLLEGRPAVGAAAARGLLAAVSCGLLLGAVELSRSPQLVGFAAPTVLNQPSIAQIERPASRNSHLDLTPVMAQMTQNAPQAAHLTLLKMQIPPAAGRTPMRPATKGPRPQLESRLQPRQRLLKTSLPEPREAAEPAWIVLTAWQQVEPLANLPISDQTAASGTDSGPDVAGIVDSDSHPDASGAATANRVQVTRLIFRVVSGSASGAAPRQASPTSLPGLSLRGGWIFLQL